LSLIILILILSESKAHALKIILKNRVWFYYNVAAMIVRRFIASQSTS